MSARADLETPIKDVFADAARQSVPTLKEECIRRRKTGRIAPDSWGLTENQKFYFGDLRIDLDDRDVIIETESAGGTTNLSKYWPSLPELPKALFLIHLFPGGSPNNLVSHRKLWDFIYSHIKSDEAARCFKAWQYVYELHDPASLTPAIEQFEACLTQPLDQLLI